MTCLDCPNPITVQSKTGRCRTCAIRVVNSDPIAIARRASANRQKAKANGHIYGKRLLEAKREAMKDPEKRARIVAAQYQNSKAMWTPEARRKWFASRKASQVKRVNTMLAWCPPKWRDEYRRLLNRGKWRANTARKAIEDRIAAERARMTPFERQMEAVRNGAGISIKPRIVREYDFTLGGVSPL